MGPIQLKRDGFWLLSEIPQGDVFIPEKQVHGALQGEEVLVLVNKVSAKGREGKVKNTFTIALSYGWALSKERKRGRHMCLWRICRKSPERSI